MFVCLATDSSQKENTTDISIKYSSNFLYYQFSPCAIPLLKKSFWLVEVIRKIATGSDTSCCTDSPWSYNGATYVSLVGVEATVGTDTVICSIESITLWGLA